MFVPFTANWLCQKEGDPHEGYNQLVRRLDRDFDVKLTFTIAVVEQGHIGSISEQGVFLFFRSCWQQSEREGWQLEWVIVSVFFSGGLTPDIFLFIR